MNKSISAQTLQQMQVGMFAEFNTMEQLIAHFGLKGDQVAIAMCAYNTALNIAQQNCDVTPVVEAAVGEQFEDSIDATEFMESIEAIVKDPRLEHWSDVTDQNYGTRSKLFLHNIQASYDCFMDQMHNADEG